MRLFIRISYNGASFCGWQSQPNAPSVQSELERALSIAFHEPVSVVGAGRTDAGVNARGYFAHFDISAESVTNAEEICSKTNAILPKGIVVSGLFRVPTQAHARFDAVRRTYRYYIHTAKDPFANFSYCYTFPLDIGAMNRAAARIVGTRDFSCFEKTGADNATSICTVYEALWEMVDGTHLVFTVSANRFLRNMVRAIVGTLLDIGRGKHDLEWIDEVLASGDRCRAGQSVPGEALFLDGVQYGFEMEELFSPTPAK